MTDRASAGARDKRITVQHLTESTGSGGYPIETWAPLMDLDAARQDLTGDERFAVGMLAAVTRTRWDTEYRPELDPDIVDVAKRRRVLYKTRIFDIVDARHVGRYDGLILITVAKTA